MKNKDKFYRSLKIFGISFLFALVCVEGIRFQLQPLYLESVTDGYVAYNKVPSIQFDLPEEVEGKLINLKDVSVSEEELSALIKSNYVCRDEKYGMMLVGPDLMVLAVQDQNLVSKNVKEIRNADDLEIFLNREVQIGLDIDVRKSVQKDINEESVKIIAPISLSEFSFSTKKITDSYTGFVSVIQEGNHASGICVIATPINLPYDKVKEQQDICKTIARSFRANTNIYSDYVSYGNNIYDFSYEEGGLFSYSGYLYKNLGTRELDTKGTYNKIDEFVGMYCVKTEQYGLINLPYILSDTSLKSSVIEHDKLLRAEIHSETSKLKYDVTINSFSESKKINDVLTDIRKMIKQDYKYFSEEFGYKKKRIISEQVDQGTTAIITVCGWDNATGESVVVYYKLAASKDVYTITRIENHKKVTDDIDPLLERLVGLAGIILI